MHIICLTPLEPGVYNDHYTSNITTPPEGWAYIPEDFPLPSTFPRLGSIEAEELTYKREVEDENGEPVIHEYTMMTVTAMTEGTLPEPVPVPEPEDKNSVWDELDAAYQEGVNSAYDQ